MILFLRSSLEDSPQVVHYYEDERVSQIWPCYQSGCYCRGFPYSICKFDTLTVSIEGSTAHNLTPLSDCRLGDNIKFQTSRLYGPVCEIAIFEAQGRWIIPAVLTKNIVPRHLVSQGSMSQVVIFKQICAPEI